MHLLSIFFPLLVLLCPDAVLCKKGKLIRLDEETWSQLLTGEWMVEFYAPWCPACKQLEPQWEQFSSWSDDLSIKVASVDVTTNPGLSGRFMVTALPTIYHVKDGIFRTYKGGRDSNTFVSFVEEKKWEKIDPISKWKNPSSLQMSLVSYFFKISMALRAVHNRLVEEYGIPQWGSYVLFAFATILLGALLGLLIVCMIDLVFPARPLPPDDRSRPPPPDSSSQGTASTTADEREEEAHAVRRRKAGEKGDEDDEEEEEEKETKKDS